MSKERVIAKLSPGKGLSLTEVEVALSLNGFGLLKDELNIIGLRNVNATPDSFDDWLVVAHNLRGIWIKRAFKITTVPGKVWLEKAFTPAGTAVLVPGRFEKSFRPGFHKNKAALVQCKPLPVFRDHDNNGRVDCYPESKCYGMFGINIHRAGKLSKIIGPWSAGCQVFQCEQDFLEFLDWCNMAKQDLFTYTLVEFAYGM